LKLFKYVMWLLLVLMVLVGIDQVMMRLPLSAPVVQQVQVFYVDFRARLLGLDKNDVAIEPVSIDAVIEKTTQPHSRLPEKSGRYLYVDDSGTLQFADSFLQVPVKYRDTAQLLAE